MNTLYFEKISQFDRQAEPVTVSIPFAQGRLAAPRALIIRDGDVILPVQRRVLATWPDGGTKWQLVHFQLDLPGNGDKTLHFEIADSPPDVEPQATVEATETPEGIEVDTGPLSFLVPNEGFTLRYDGREVSSASGPVELEIEEAGPCVPSCWSRASTGGRTASPIIRSCPPCGAPPRRSICWRH